MSEITGKQRMLNAYKGIPCDRVPIAPEFWIYYPAETVKMLLTDRRFENLHQSLIQYCFDCLGKVRLKNQAHHPLING